MNETHIFLRIRNVKIILSIGYKKVTQKYLRLKTNITGSHLGNKLKTCIEMGLVEKVNNNRDQRLKTYALTEEGKILYKQFYSIFQSLGLKL